MGLQLLLDHFSVGRVHGGEPLHELGEFLTFLRIQLESMINSLFDKTDGTGENNYVLLLDFPFVSAISAQKFQSISVVAID